MRKQSDPEEANGYQMPEASSHTMSIALETHTLNPLLVQRDKKLVTAADLRMMDAVDQPLLVGFPFGNQEKGLQYPGTGFGDPSPLFGLERPGHVNL